MRIVCNYNIIIANNSQNTYLLIFYMENLIAATLAIIVISLISLFGVFTLSWNDKFLKKFNLFIVSLAAGTLIANVFLQIIPEVFHLESDERLASSFIILGILVFFILEKILHWNHCHQGIEGGHNHNLATKNLIADGIHNYVDGLLIGAAFSVGIEFGVATTIAIALHEIPQEIGDFSILIHSGLSKAKALVFNFLSALTAILGLVTTVLIGSINPSFEAYLLGIAAGGFLYIAIADLLPEIKHENNNKKSFLQLTFFILGIAIMLLVSFIAPHSHEVEEHDDDDEEEESHAVYLVAR